MYAKYSGKCNLTGQTINIGDEISVIMWRGCKITVKGNMTTERFDSLVNERVEAVALRWAEADALIAAEGRTGRNEQNFRDSLEVRMNLNGVIGWPMRREWLENQERESIQFIKDF